MMLGDLHRYLKSFPGRETLKVPQMAAKWNPNQDVMALSLPPRKPRQISVKTQRRPIQSPLEILLSMGFTKHRSEKALAATGYKNVQVASDWLLSHINDQTLDEVSDREYILYLCPVGDLRGQLEDIGNQTLQQCGWNKGHDFLPHVTLCSFFHAKDTEVPVLLESMEALTDKLKSLKTKVSEISLHLVAQESFVGLDMKEEEAAFLKQIAHIFESILQTKNITIQPQKKKMHVSIAYAFPKAQVRALSGIAADVFDSQASASWDLRLYSRDARFGQHQVHKVLYPHTAQNPDELDLINGDFIYVDEKEIDSSPDDWYMGTSWLTGCVGLFPGNYTVRVPGTDAWSLLKSIKLLGHDANTLSMNGTVEKMDYEDSPEYAKIKKKRPQRQLFIIRHGERVDFVFGKFWYQKCFDHTGYVRLNLNMPETLPARQWGPNDWREDCPVTVQGQFQAKLTGESLKAKGVQINHVYVSPAYRCVQTASAILEGLGTDIPLRIEPGLYEWMGWYKKYVPKWYHPEQLKKLGFNIDTKYTAIIPKEKLNIEETVEQLYSRGYQISKTILKKHEPHGGNVLIVGHAGSLDTNTKQLTGGKPSDYSNFHMKLIEIPFLAVAQCQETHNKNEWELVEPPILPFTHSGNKPYNWEILKIPS